MKSLIKMLRFSLLLATAILLAFTSCKQQKKEPIIQQPTKVTFDSTVVEKKQNTISPQLLSIVKYIDSCGYLFDTTRYNTSDDSKLIIENGYVFFDIQKEKTIPYYDKMNDGSHPFHDAIENFSTKPLDKASKVTSYYFRQKEPTIINGKKWFIDGVIEEWAFTSTDEAQDATNELIKTDLTALYANTGACVCCIDKQLYIFHSRATFFMSKQREFFKWFTSQYPTDLLIDDSY